MHPIRVLHVVHHLHLGGTEKLVSEMALAISKHQIVPILCCLDEIGVFGEDLKKKGLQVILLNRRPGLDWKIIFSIRKICIRYKIEVIHAHHYTPFFYSSLTRLICPKIRLIFTEHGRLYPDKKKWKRRLINPFLKKLCNNMIAISNSTKKALIDIDNFPRQAPQVIYNGIHCENFGKHNKAQERNTLLGLDNKWFIFGTISRLDSIKNIPLMLSAFSKIQKCYPKMILVIVGDGPEKRNLENLVNNLAIKENVFMLGLRKDISNILSTFDVFLLTSYTEGTSITLLEAMASSLPVIVTAVGGNTEVVTDNVTGFFIPSDDVEALRNKMQYVINSKSLRLGIGAKAKKTIEHNFSFKKMLSQYVMLYKNNPKN